MGEFSVASGTSTAWLDLTGRSALVTGTASGIGRACAERLARAGAMVTVLDLNGDAAKEVADEIGDEAMQADLSNYEVLEYCGSCWRRLSGSYARRCRACTRRGGGT